MPCLNPTMFRAAVYLPKYLLTSPSLGRADARRVVSAMDGSPVVTLSVSVILCDVKSIRLRARSCHSLIAYSPAYIHHPSIPLMGAAF